MAEVEIYTFACGLQTWHYTDALLPVSYMSNTYDAYPIKRGAIEMSTDLEKATLSITVPLSLPFLDLFRPAPPLRRIYVTVMRYDRSAGTVRTIWSGTVGTLNGGPHTAEITCMSRAAAQQNTGLRRKWQKLCPLTLYQCGVDRAGYRTDATLTYASGKTIKAAAFATQPDGWFTGGYVEWTVDGDEEWRFVISHVGDTLMVLTNTTQAVGDAVQAYPGCDRTDGAAGCARFGNILNYGGQLYIPTKNPFGPNKIF